MTHNSWDNGTIGNTPLKAFPNPRPPPDTLLQTFRGASGNYSCNFGTAVRGLSPASLQSATIAAPTRSSAAREAYIYSTGEIESALTNATSLWYTLAGLETGQPYFVRVSARNARGYGLPRSSKPSYLAPPIQAPASPEGVHIFPSSSSSLRCEGCCVWSNAQATT